MTSLERFRTVAFDEAMIRDTMKMPRDDPGRIDITQWIAIVPEVYRRTVLRLVGVAFEEVRGHTINPLYPVAEFAAALHRLIWENLQPIEPVETERWRIETTEMLVSKVIAGEAQITSFVTGLDDGRLLTQVTISDVDEDAARFGTLEFTERMAMFWAARLDKIRKES